MSQNYWQSLNDKCAVSGSTTKPNPESIAVGVVRRKIERRQAKKMYQSIVYGEVWT